MKIDTRCPICGAQGEDGGHFFFFKCSLAKQVWNMLILEGLRQKLAAQTTA